MRKSTRTKNYEGLLSQDLANLAESRGIILSGKQRRGLYGIRGVAEDVIGDQARDEVIAKLQMRDSVRSRYMGTAIAVLSLFIAAVGLLSAQWHGVCNWIERII